MTGIEHVELLQTLWPKDKQPSGRWHNRIKRISRKAHPILYEVLELFQREHAASEVTILQLEAGGAFRQKRRKRLKENKR